MRFKDPQVLGPGLYRTDAFHRTPLFAVRPPGHDPDKPPLVVRSWEEAYALHGEPTLDDIDATWLGGYICDEFQANISPYHRIQRLPRAHDVVIHADCSINTVPYDPLAGGAEPMEEADLHCYVRQALLSTLNNSLERLKPKQIACELSSGIDSNCITGALMHGLRISAETVFTISDLGWGEGELINNFREFHGLLQENMISYSFQPTGHPTQELLDGYSDLIRKLGAPPQVAYLPIIIPVRQLASLGVEVLFSGCGGDECLSNNAKNVPTDFVSQFRWHELVKWVGGKRKAVRIILSRSAGLVSRRWAVAKLRKLQGLDTYQYPLKQHISDKGLSLINPPEPSINTFNDSYLRHQDAIRELILSDFLALRIEEETRLATQYGIHKMFPLVNEQLIATLLRQDSARFGASAGQGRLIARESFKDFLPGYLHKQPSKIRAGATEERNALTDAMAKEVSIYMEAINAAAHPLLHEYWNLDDLNKHIDQIGQKGGIDKAKAWDYGYALEKLMFINSWFKLLGNV